MTAPTVRVFNQPNLLKSRAAEPGGKSFEDLVQQGDQVVAEHHTDYRDVANSDLMELRTLVDRIKAAPEESTAQLKGLFRIAHDMKGQASTFGYPVITSVADSLCRFVEKIEETGRPVTDNVQIVTEIVGLHLDALRLLLQHDVKGPGVQLELQLMTGLKAASEKILATIGVPAA